MQVRVLSAAPNGVCMSKKAFNKIAAGLNEALSIARCDAEPAGVTYYTPAEQDQIRRQLRNGNKLAREAVQRLGIKVHPRIAAIRPTPVAPAEMEMIDEKSIAETSPREVEEGA